MVKVPYQEVILTRSRRLTLQVATCCRTLSHAVGVNGLWIAVGDGDGGAGDNGLYLALPGIFES